MEMVRNWFSALFHAVFDSGPSESSDEEESANDGVAKGQDGGKGKGKRGEGGKVGKGKRGKGESVKDVIIIDPEHVEKGVKGKASKSVDWPPAWSKKPKSKKATKAWETAEEERDASSSGATASSGLPRGSAGESLEGDANGKGEGKEEMDDGEGEAKGKGEEVGRKRQTEEGEKGATAKASEYIFCFLCAQFS